MRRWVTTAICWIALVSIATLGTNASSTVGAAFEGAVPATVADAAMKGDLDVLRQLLDEGGDLNAARGDGMTGLHWAAKTGDLEVARLLLEREAALESSTRVGSHTPLHVASSFGHDAVVNALVEAGADVNAKTETGASPLHFAAASGSADSVSILLEHGAELGATEPFWGQTPLMFAAAAGRSEVIELLLELGADPSITGLIVDISERNKADQAERRARNKRIAEMRAAERQGSPSDENVTAEPSDKPTAAEIQKRQREREEANASGNEPVPLNYAGLVGTHGGLTPLLLAVREGHDDAAITLIQGGADINQVGAGDHASPMFVATINGHFDLAMKLFEMGADPTIENIAGGTPLYAALNMQWAPKARHPQPVHNLQQETTYLEMMETLLKAGVDPNLRLEKTLWFTQYNRDMLGVNRAGATPFWRAAHALDLRAMKLLLAYGADPHLPTIRVPERKRRGDDGVDHSGLDPIPLGGPAVYPIHAASGVGHGQGFAGNTHRHVPDGWLPAVKFLVEELGADVTARDHRGYTPLHHAASRGDDALIEYLVSKGADATAVARSGQTTADMANGPVQRVSPYPTTIALLEKLGSKNNHNCLSC